MKLRALRLWNVRRFAGRGIAIENISDGVNVLSAENEQGKSTSFDALQALFFHPHSGTPKFIQLLRPYSGGSPQIEVDVDTPLGQFRINKQFYSGKRAMISELPSGRIIAQADAAETWIANLVEGGVSGPTGLLWVQQGANEIGGGSLKERDEARKTREDVLATATGEEIETLTGGRRMLRVLAKTSVGLDRLVTSTGKARAGGPFAEALDQLEALRAEENMVSNQIDELRNDLVKRRQKTSRLKEINDPEARECRRRDRKQAEEALTIANLHSDKIKIVLANENLASNKYETARDNRIQYSEALDRLHTLKGRLAEEEIIHAETFRNLEVARSSQESARKEFEIVESALDDARRTLDRSKIYANALIANSQFSEIKERWEKSLKARDRIEMLSAEFEALKIPADYLAKLEEIERDISILSVSSDAESASAIVDYFEEPRTELLLRGESVVAGRSYKITVSEAFSIPGVGTLTVSPGTDAGTGNSLLKLSVARDELREKLSTYSLESVSSGRQRFFQANQKSAELLAARAELVALAPDGISALRTRIGALESQLEIKISPEMDVESAQTMLSEVQSSFQLAKVAYEVAGAALQGAHDVFVRRDASVAAARVEIEGLEQRLGSLAERESTKQTLTELEFRLAGELAEISRVAVAMRQSAPDIENIAAAHARVVSIDERAQAEAAMLDKEIAELNGRITISAGNGIEENLVELREKRELEDSRVTAYRREIAGLIKLKQILESARYAAKEQYFEPVMAELKPLLTLLLDKASITFDAATLLPETLVRDGQDEEIGVLSGGMREQLAILTRLAFARLLSKGGHQVPVILDDALVYSDDIRIERMFDVLHRQARDLQILILTCRQRAFERLGGNVLQMIAWKPLD